MNFRYEPGGREHQQLIKQYERETPGSMRNKLKKSQRAEKRREVKERKEQEKNEFRKSMQMLKDIKKSRIEERLSKISQISGLKEITGGAEKAKLKNLINQEFDPKNFDKNMEELFNEEYFEEEEDEEAELKAYIKDIEKQFDDQILGDTITEKKVVKKTKDGKEFRSRTLNEDDENLFTPKTSVPIMLKKKINKTEANLLATSLKEPIWWYCDSCFTGIQPYDHRYDCLECGDFTECKKCASLKTHEHQMRKFVVPEGCTPPPDAEIHRLLEKLIICNGCESKMDDTFLYYHHKKMEDYYLCEDCFTFHTTSDKEDMKIKDFNVIKPTRLNVKKAVEKGQFYKLKGKDSELDELIDDYANVDFEDVIAGGIKTRFRYTDVNNEAFLLTDDEILYCDDKLLNKYLSLKKLAPYKDQEVM